MSFLFNILSMFVIAFYYKLKILYSSNRISWNPLWGYSLVLCLTHSGSSSIYRINECMLQSFFCGNWLNFTLKVWFLLFSTDSVGTVRKFLKPFSLLNSFLSGNLPHKWQPPLPFQTLVYFLSPARFSCSPYIFFLSGFLSCTAFYTMYKKYLKVMEQNINNISFLYMWSISPWKVLKLFLI